MIVPGLSISTFWEVEITAQGLKLELGYCGENAIKGVNNC